MREIIPLSLPKPDPFQESLINQIVLDKNTKVLKEGGHDAFRIVDVPNVQKVRIMRDLMNGIGRRRVGEYAKLILTPTTHVKVSRIRELLPYSMVVAVESGLPADIILAQAIIEAGWRGVPFGRSYFGISDKKLGKQAEFRTEEEYVKGIRTKVKKKFNVYDRIIDSFRDYARFIYGNSRYRDVVANYFKVGSSLEYLKGIKARGYATASNYVTSVWNVRESVMTVIRSTPPTSMARSILNPFEDKILDYESLYQDISSNIKVEALTTDWTVQSL